PRLHLRVVEAGARLRAHARPLPPRAAPARQARFAPAPAGRARARLRADAVGRGVAGRPRPPAVGMSQGRTAGWSPAPATSRPATPSRRRPASASGGSGGQAPRHVRNGRESARRAASRPRAPSQLCVESERRGEAPALAFDTAGPAGAAADGPWLSETRQEDRLAS